MNDVLTKCRLADIVAVGEHMHGDKLSWDVRLRLVRDAVRAGHAVTILCENLDAYVAGLSEVPIKFRDEPDGFYPNMMAWAQDRRTHLAATRALAQMAEGRVYGIDVQALCFEDTPQLRGRKLVRDALKRVRQVWLANKESMNRGAIRNVLNAETVLRLWDVLSSNGQGGGDKPAKFFYFAHNEHVALSCHETRRNPSYVPDGALLAQGCARRGIKYLSVGTYAPVMQAKRGLLTHTDHNPRWREQQRRIRERVEEQRWRHAGVCRGASRKVECTATAVLHSLGDDMGMGSYRTSDFHVVVVSESSLIQQRQRL